MHYTLVRCRVRCIYVHDVHHVHDVHDVHDVYVQDSNVHDGMMVHCTIVFATIHRTCRAHLEV